VQPSEVYFTPTESSDHTPGNEKTGLDKAARTPKRTKIKVPLDILISLLRPDELAKLQRYVASYLEKH
jgi:hypothetical protein